MEGTKGGLIQASTSTVITSTQAWNQHKSQDRFSPPPWENWPSEVSLTSPGVPFCPPRSTPSCYCVQHSFTKAQNNERQDTEKTVQHTKIKSHKTNHLFFSWFFFFFFCCPYITLFCSLYTYVTEYIRSLVTKNTAKKNKNKNKKATERKKKTSRRRAKILPPGPLLFGASPTGG